MGGIATVGSICSGHGGFPARNAISGSPDVFVNGIAALRAGDGYVTHSDGHSSHDAVIATGAPTIFINGLPAAMVGSLLSCGSTIASGSLDVLIG